jgi:hypothetical protein
MDGNKVNVYCTLFISGWIMFLGSLFFEIMGGNFLISTGRISKIFYVADVLPYLGLLLVAIPTVAFVIRYFRNRQSHRDA